MHRDFTASDLMEPIGASQTGSKGGMFVIDRIRQQQGGGPTAGGARPRRKRSGLSAVANHVMSTLVFFGSIRLIYMWKNRHALA